MATVSILRMTNALHAARDADAAEQQRDEADDAEEVAKLVDRFGEIELRLRRRCG